jgi:hypothetical protein
MAEWRTVPPPRLQVLAVLLDVDVVPRQHDPRMTDARRALTALPNLL